MLQKINWKNTSSDRVNFVHFVRNFCVGEITLQQDTFGWCEDVAGDGSYEETLFVPRGNVRFVQPTCSFFESQRTRTVSNNATWNGFSARVTFPVRFHQISLWTVVWRLRTSQKRPDLKKVFHSFVEGRGLVISGNEPKNLDAHKCELRRGTMFFYCFSRVRFRTIGCPFSTLM